MLYLATASTPPVRDAMRCGLLGQMIQPKAGNRLLDGVDWAVDNGVVKLVAGAPVVDPAWRPDRWLALLERHQDKPGCLFAVVPDVVCDAAATDARWQEWAPTVQALGYPAAYVAQNGCETIPDDADVLFLGGDTQWKLGRVAARLVAIARRRGLWAHMGRVNSLRRLRYAAQIGCDSADGTYLAFGPDANLPRLLGWLHPAQSSLFGGVA